MPFILPLNHCWYESLQEWPFLEERIYYYLWEFSVFWKRISHRELTDGVESFSLLPASPGKRAQNHRLSISQNTLTPLPDSKLGFLPIPQGQSQESQTIEDFSENSPNSAQKDSVAEKSEGGMQTRDNPIANQQEPKSIETIESISKSTEENEIAKWVNFTKRPKFVIRLKTFVSATIRSFVFEIFLRPWNHIPLPKLPSMQDWMQIP